MKQDCKLLELPPELSARIAGFLRPNELACTLRLVNRAAAAQFGGPQHTTVRLSQPVPPHAFARHWGAPGATRQLSFKQRLRLLCLTAASGSIPNMEVALEAAGCLLTEKVFQAAAAAGQRAMCEWLLQQGCPHYGVLGAMNAAAKTGQLGMCLWLLGQDVSFVRPEIFCGYMVLEAAARGGQVDVILRLMRTYPGYFRLPGTCETRAGLLVAVAEGCDLATLRQLHREWFGAPQEGGGGQQQQQQQGHPAEHWKARLLAAAAGSPTPDWGAKVEWLEGQGYQQAESVCNTAAACPDAVERLTWLRGRGYPTGLGAVKAAASAGNLAALQYLHAENVEMGGALTVAAARHGHLSVVAWLVEAPGVDVDLDEELFSAAAGSGSLELMVWLRERNCPFGTGTFKSAALGGNEAALEWLADRGCPMGADGQPYIQALRNQDPPTLHCLVRLGCPWGPPGEVVNNIDFSEDSAPALMWELSAIGCPVD